LKHLLFYFGVFFYFIIFICQYRGHFESAGYITIAHDVDEIRDNAQLEEIMHNYQPPIKAIIGVHAYRAGRLIPGAEIPEIALKNENNEGNEEFKIANNLLRSTCPWILILGGTDVNENVKDPKLMNTMTKAIQFASWEFFYFFFLWGSFD